MRSTSDLPNLQSNEASITTPLQPAVLMSQPGDTVGGVTVTPGVRQSDVQPVTSTYAS